jgi:hypothetical protein
LEIRTSWLSEQEKDMKRTILMLFMALSGLTAQPAIATDHGVFGLTLGVPLNIGDCGYGVVETPISHDSTCINTAGAKRWKEDTRDTSEGTDVWICFSRDQWPDIANSERYITGRILDGQLHGITFITYGAKNADDVMKVLVKKYGRPTKLTTGEMQNQMGAAFGAFTAEWYMKDMFVFFESISGKMDLGFVRIGTKRYLDVLQRAKQEKSKAQRKL